VLKTELMVIVYFPSAFIELPPPPPLARVYLYLPLNSNLKQTATGCDSYYITYVAFPRRWQRSEEGSVGDALDLPTLCILMPRYRTQWDPRELSRDSSQIVTEEL
jgi:hypothetical protein